MVQEFFLWVVHCFCWRKSAIAFIYTSCVTKFYILKILVLLLHYLLYKKNFLDFEWFFIYFILKIQKIFQLFNFIKKSHSYIFNFRFKYIYIILLCFSNFLTAISFKNIYFINDSGCVRIGMKFGKQLAFQI